MKLKAALCSLLTPILIATVPNQSNAAAMPSPKLIVAISVDQFSADLFAEYRASFTGGLKRLQQGAVFSSGYQSHAMTETCPGHSTILTGDRPARTGIIANDWFDFSAPREDKQVYCVEKEDEPNTTSTNYLVSTVHLRVPTLGAWMKKRDPRVQVVSVAGKDRAAVMMGGDRTDEIWWWNGKGFVSFAGRQQPAIVSAVNARTTGMIATGLPAPVLSPKCAAKIETIDLELKTVGGAPGSLAPGKSGPFRARREFDQAVLDIASGLIESRRLGRGEAADLIAIGLSATDYVGHYSGTEGPEMCVQIAALDAALGRFFDTLDASGIAYAVMLTADHGGQDLPERNRMHGLEDARRLPAGLSVVELNKALGIPAKGKGFRAVTIGGDLYLSPDYKGAKRRKLLDGAEAWLRQWPEIEGVYSRKQIASFTIPTDLPPADWSIEQRLAASYDPERSGDFFVALKPRVIPIYFPPKEYVAAHGSPWNYDRRVPILFWWPGIIGFEQPNGIETIDIMPSLAALIGVPLAPGDVDGTCRDLDPGPSTTCPAAQRR